MFGGADLKRRHALSGLLGGLLMLPVFRANALSRRDPHGRLIRPPGALPEGEFLSRCIGCGACMKACPTNAIQPCTLVDGVHRLYTPRVVPRIGGCEEKCHLCGYVCPTGALRKLPHEEKQFAKIGTAVIDRHRCLAWSQNKECVVCDEVCPYNAIDVRVEQTTKGPFKVPIVFEDECLGCGMCEQHCPITNTAAIVVYQFGEKRLSHGPYATAAEKKGILAERKRSDAHLSVESAQAPAVHSPEVQGAAGSGGAKEQEGGLPPGFLAE
jgi:MauM/NapG family ferredoxin protein